MDATYLRLAVAALVLLTCTAASADGLGRPSPSCNRTCGGVAVLYPFGLAKDAKEAGCYNPSGGFDLTCNDSFTPPKLFVGDFEVTAINISSMQMVVLVRMSFNCYSNSSGIPSASRTIRNRFALSTRRISYTENEFIAVGCDTIFRYQTGENSFAGCISSCNKELESVEEGKCSGFGCYKMPIPMNIRLFEIKYWPRSNGSETYKYNNCSYSFMTQKSNYTFRRSDLVNMDRNRRFPLVLDWAFRRDDLTCEQARKNTTSYACVGKNSDCVNSINGPGYYCKCLPGYEGNPYLQEGCTDIDECADEKKNPCKGKCHNTVGNYTCDSTAESLPLAFKLLIGIGGGVAVLLVGGLTCCVGFQRKKMQKLREKCFERNGGLFLQQVLSSDRRSTFKIFSMGEVEKATNGFDKEQILGQGGYGTVYRGLLDDGRTVAIKRCMVVDEKNGRDFANELFILSEINHKNVVKLLGCCLDDEVPMLIYEFISRGTLFDYIHGKGPNPPQPIGFHARLRIATEAAEAIKYLHADASPPILHGDIKSSNILLEGANYTAKVSDFGTSTLASKDMAKFTTFIQGTYGYLDPEYLMNGSLTDRSDVFSFGVVLAELLTRRKPFKFDAATEGEKSLAVNFISCANGNKLEEIIDPEIMQEEGISEDVREVVQIAVRCLSLRGEERPPMKEVAAALESVSGVRRHPANWSPTPPEEVEPLLTTAAPDSTQLTNTIHRHHMFGIDQDGR